ncbi:hypothetical protein Q5752_001030 [Cryptotrichosporon argae]
MSVVEPSQLARPVSLVLTPTRATFDIAPVIDTKSYSPFPTLPGSSRTHDPFGLNAFLLHPADALWDYMEPKPAIPGRSLAGPESVVQPGLDAVTDDRGRSLGRRKSLVLRAGSVFRKSSPLASSDGSKAETIEEPPKAWRKSAGRHSLRRVIHQRRMSDAPPVPDFVKDADVLVPLPVRPETDPTDDGDSVAEPSTPMSTRSQSASSAKSSASSDDGLRTPADEPTEIAVRLNLADVLEDAEAKRAKSGWRSWLGGKRGSRLTPSSSADTTPSGSTAPSPSASTVSLAPSPSIAPSRVLPSDALRQRAAARVRQSSLSKLAAIRSPSPHPLALLLTRQRANLPDEVASSIPAGHRVFPRSVNLYQPHSDTAPPRASLRASIAIHIVVSQIDNGQWPETLPPLRQPSRQATVRRPRGVRDFVDRAPFEERNVVFFANDTFSPISMARPGNAVWDLDFSRYMLALAEAEAGRRWSASVGPVPRISLTANMDGLEGMLQQAKLIASPVEDAVEALKTLTSNAEIRIVLPSPDPSLQLTAAAPAARLSSFRRRPSTTWESSDSEDEAPLSSLAVRRQPSAPALKTRARSETAMPTRARTSSQPERAIRAPDTAEKRRSRVVSPDDALVAVAKARERRSAFLSGAIDKHVEGERMRDEHRKSQISGPLSLAPPKILVKRRSTPDLDTVHEGATAASATKSSAQRRTASTADVRPAMPMSVSRSSMKTAASTPSKASLAPATPPRPTLVHSAPNTPANRTGSSTTSSPQPRRVHSAYDAPAPRGPVPRMPSFYGVPAYARTGAISHAAYPMAATQVYGAYAHPAYAYSHSAYAYSHPALIAFPTQHAPVVAPAQHGKERRIA